MYMLTTNLQGADLRGADLMHTLFTSSSNFRNADLRGANLLDVWFTDADLRGADLRGSNVELIKTPEGAIYAARKWMPASTAWSWQISLMEYVCRTQPCRMARSFEITVNFSKA